MLTDTLQSDLKKAMLARDAVRLRALRSVRAAIQEKEIELRGTGSKDLTDSDVVTLLQKQAKQRRDSIEQFDQAGRTDLATAEREELEVIETYLPKQLGDGEIRAIVNDIVQEVGAVSMSDIGKVMGPAMSRLRGEADGRRVNEIVRDILSRASE